jgi:hypothetical protein
MIKECEECGEVFEAEAADEQNCEDCLNYFSDKDEAEDDDEITDVEEA